MQRNRWIASLAFMLPLLALLWMAQPGRSHGANALATATPVVSPTPTASSQPDLADIIDAKLGTLADRDLFNGAVLVAQDGEVLLRKGYGIANREHDVPMTVETKFRIGTLTSLFTALAIMRLVQDGAIGLDDSICDYVDACPETWQPITIDHLLTRTSGLPTFESMPAVSTLLKTGASSKILLDSFRDAKLTAKPGEQWAYSQMNDFLLGLVIDKAGVTYRRYLQQTILDPLAMTDSGLDTGRGLLPNRADGYADATAHADYVDIATLGAAAAMYSTVDDLHRLAQGLAYGAILSDTVVAEMSAPRISVPGFYGGPADYTYGWFLNEFKGRRRVIGTGGVEGYMADMHLFPDDGVVVIVLGNRDDQDTYPIAELIEGWIFGGQ